MVYLLLEASVASAMITLARLARLHSLMGWSKGPEIGMIVKLLTSSAIRIKVAGLLKLLNLLISIGHCLSSANSVKGSKHLDYRAIVSFRGVSVECRHGSGKQHFQDKDINGFHLALPFRLGYG
jgi:hypothetical protein